MLAGGSANSNALGPRYVVSIRMTGLGDRLICLAAAWLYARATGRTLVVDWRFGYLSPDSRTNGFSLCFRNRGQLGGVSIIADDSVARLAWPRPRYPLIWNIASLQRRPFLRPPASIESDRDAAVKLIRGNRDRPEPVVVFDACVNDGIVRFQDAREFFQSLQPVDSVTEAVDALRRERFLDRPVIGLHIRHGNGGDVLGHARFWNSFEQAIARCLRCVELARERLGSDASVFLCTDSTEVEDAIRKALPGAFARPKRFRPPGAGELHADAYSWKSNEDALAEMLLLSHTQALIRYPPGSFFSLYAAVMKQRTQAPPPTLYDLLSSGDATDSLSPALVI
jgi:hypothetical protein